MSPILILLAGKITFALCKWFVDCIYEGSFLHSALLICSTVRQHILVLVTLAMIRQQLEASLPPPCPPPPNHPPISSPPCHSLPFLMDLVYWLFWVFYLSIEPVCQYPQNNFLGFWQGLQRIYRSSWEDILTILSPHPWTWGIFPFIQIFKFSFIWVL